MTKPTWIFVAGPYRSGSTTQYEMARDIVEKTNTGIGIGYHNERRLKEFDAGTTWPLSMRHSRKKKLNIISPRSRNSIGHHISSSARCLNSCPAASGATHRTVKLSPGKID